ncbi:GATA-binding transcription factor [Heterostelium album PN500]|uniref:GATA-binding transcription factor n=1 Tax=Heterostelium pallidum (strain ATCC 26659 / Pp 5 / PN500) TaxID=670386 RepID=D3BCC4_HETP5|nr:GATA-binding transcription factor [Heterostelium album PN500]EFA80914.1 GATA-binding transcription factor [Heterostelium album PN500]|eukprot:XP_020433032.1 GATA-binding transcription factor [Heterostelium album PN500]
MNNNHFLMKNPRVVADHFSNLCDVLPPTSQSTSHYIPNDYQQPPTQLHSGNPYIYQQQQQQQLQQQQQQQDYHLVYQSSQPLNYYNNNLMMNQQQQQQQQLQQQQPMLNAALSLSSIHKARSSLSNIHHQKSMSMSSASTPKVFATTDSLSTGELNSDTNTNGGTSPSFSSDNSSPSLDQQPSSPIDSSHPNSSSGSVELYTFTGSSEMKSNKLSNSSSCGSIPLHSSIPGFSLNHGCDAQADYDSLREAWKKTKDLSQDLTKISKQASKSEFTLVDSVNALQKEYENLGNLLNFMNEKANNLKNDERLKKKKKESDRNAEKRKKRREATMLLNNVCKNCNTTDTPEWRKGPDGTKSLCNACGLHYAKNLKRETMNQPNPVIQPKETMKVLSILN